MGVPGEGTTNRGAQRSTLPAEAILQIISQDQLDALLAADYRVVKMCRDEFCCWFCKGALHPGIECHA